MTASCPTPSIRYKAWQRTLFVKLHKAELLDRGLQLRRLLVPELAQTRDAFEHRLALLLNILAGQVVRVRALPNTVNAFSLRPILKQKPISKSLLHSMAATQKTKLLITLVPLHAQVTTSRSCSKYTLH